MGLVLKTGWAETDITPREKVYLIGQLSARVSEGVMDPVTATALAFESVKDGRPAGHAVMVSCDLVAVSKELRAAVRGYAAGEPGLEPGNIILNATHTHSAPHIRSAGFCSGHPGQDNRDAGVRICERANAAQTFPVQLSAGEGGYFPSARSVAGGGYGSVPASTNIGPDGGGGPR